MNQDKWNIINQNEMLFLFWTEVAWVQLFWDRIYKITASHLPKTSLVVEELIIMSYSQESLVFEDEVAAYSILTKVFVGERQSEDFNAFKKELKPIIRC